MSELVSLIAAGKVSANGDIIKSTPGIEIRPEINPGDLAGRDIGYTVKLPKGLVDDSNYIIQLTAENFKTGEDFFVNTSIAYRYQSINRFEVIIWANEEHDDTTVPVKSNWSFVLYNIKKSKPKSISA